MLHVLARMSAGTAHGLYGHQAWLARQLMPDTAEAEHLARHAAVWGVTRLAATAATGDVALSGTDGAVIPAGTELQTAAGASYTTDADATIDAGAAVATVTAIEPGAAGNQAAGVTVTLVSPIAGVQSQAIVAVGGLTGGAPTEDDESLRTRLLSRIQAPPHGGATRDYIAWTLEAHPDVTDVWVAAKELGIGTVTVRFMTYDATADGIPTQTVIDAVEAHLDEQRPVTADVSVVAPIAVPLDFEISGLVPNTQVVRDAVEQELRDLIRRVAEPGGTILVSQIREAISIAAGEADHQLVSPNADVGYATGEIATMGAITWS
jgi:uncharacterized phage protein gp47/JayE